MSNALKEVYVNGFNYSGSGIDGTNRDGIGSASQMPSWTNPEYSPTDFVWWDPDNSPGPYSTGSAFFQGNCEIPTHTDTVTTLRVEHSITSVNHHLFATAEYVWWSISFYTPEDYEPDSKYDVITQWHQTGSSPAISIRRVNGRFRFEIITESGWTYQQVFDVGPTVQGEWTNFVVFTKWSDELNGVLTVWRDGSLARLHHPVTGDPWVVPSELSEGVTTNWIIKELLGTLPYTIEEGGSEVSLFDWRGRTSREGGGVMPGKYLKCGIYKSSITGSYIDGNGLRPGWDDPGSQYYIPPESRVPRIGIGNVNIETRVNENTHENIYRSLDVNRSAPVEFPEWWIESEPINIVHPLNGQSFEVGSEINITTDSESGPVELIVKNNLIQIKELSPFNFSIQNISNNDSLLDIPFDGNVFEWSSNDYSISVINPDDISYESSPNGQAIILGSTELVNNRSFISIDNTGPIESIESEFTISFYIKSNYGSGLNPIVLSNNNGSNGSGISINGISNGTLEARLFEENESSINHRISISSLLSPTEYNHYILTYDGNVIRWYYNFNFVNEASIGLLDISASKDWYINAASNQAGRQNIYISNVRVYDYAILGENVYKTIEDNEVGPITFFVRRMGVESDPVTINIVESTGEYEGPYYISSNGDDSNEGSVSEPVKTIGKLNGILADGITNSVNFNRDDVFGDRLEIPTVNDGISSSPIEFKPYGSGAIPVLSGFKPIDSFVNVSVNIYEVQDDNFPDYIHKVTITGASQPKGRLPKEGWLRADSNNNNSVTSTNLPSVNYSGGQVEAVVWKMQWVVDTVTVTGRDSDTLNYTGGSSYPFSPRTDGRYYIQNAVECLTEQGDWMYDTNTKTLTIYSSVDPNTLSIAYSSDKDGIEGIGNTYNSYSELSLEGSINGIDLEGSHNNEITDLVIADQSGEGIAVRNSNNVTVDGNEISDADVRGISFTNTSSSPIVFRNKVSNIALNTGNPLANGDEKGNGIYFSNSENIDCQLNEVINVGFNGIRYNHNNALISRNLVDGFCLTKHDGSGIYTYGGASGANTHIDRVVSRNVVRNGGDSLRPNVYGVYIDDNSENISHVGNLVKDTWNAGFYIHNSHDLSFDGDIVYGCGTLFKFGQDGSNELIRDNIISNMVFVLTSKSDFGFEILSNANDVSSFFNINNNIYLVASNKQLVFTTRYVSGGKTFFNNVDFEGWQALGNDLNSSIRYLNIPEYSIISEGSNKWNGTVGSHHQDGEVTVNIDGSNVEVLMTSQSSTTTRAEIHFRLDGVESDKDYIVRFRARALSGHQSLNLYMRQSNAPYRDLGGKTAAVVGSEWEEFEFLVTDLIAEETAGYLIDCQSNQGTLEIEDFEFVEAVVEKTIYEDYILPVSNTTPTTDNISVGSGWRNLNGEETSSVELESFESTILLSGNLPAQEYEIEVTQTSGGNVTGGGTYEEGEEVTLTATPDSGFVFKRWSNNETSNPYIFVASGDTSISAVFDEAGTEGPLSEIISPENNSVFTEGDPIEIEVNVTQGSNPIDRVELYIGGNLLSTMESSPYEYTWENASPGVYNLTARVMDSEGIVGKSDPVLITVQDGPDPEPGYFTVNIKFNIV